MSEVSDIVEREAVIRTTDMNEVMQEYAVAVARQAFEMSDHDTLKDIASFIKKEFDLKYNPTWHCFVGRNFGSSVAHELRHYIYFHVGQMGILLFKSG